MKSLSLLAFICSVIVIQYVECDVYLHNPRGSNNRLYNNNRNANRVFDSQNNNKGGYNVGENTERPIRRASSQYHMKYFMSGSPTQGTPGKSILHIEWTNQHGCGDGDLNCNIVLQYMCQSVKAQRTDSPLDIKRNGQNERTPPYPRYIPRYYKLTSRRVKQRIKRIYMRHVLNEPWESYDKCNRRTRNNGLFTADQKLKGTTSRYTRQNAAGTQRGYECPEERDYYPYWHPTDWIDIAVLANKKQDCPFYKAESFNTNEKGECMERYKNPYEGWKHASIHNNPNDCKKANGEWVMFSNYLEEKKEYKTRTQCQQAGYKWGIPYRSENIDKLPRNKNSWARCLVQPPAPACRPAPQSRPNHLGNGDDAVPLQYPWVLPHFPSGETQRCVFRIRYNISTNDPQNKIKTNPIVKLLNDKLPLQLAINTAQFGRTFQDRSHIFELVSREQEKIPNDLTVHNLNVRGKRGNIVQAYPAVEYDFFPKRMEISRLDAVHYQWTGSNTNPNGNAGQGRRGTDRSNFVQMRNASFSYPIEREDKDEMFAKAQLIWAADDKTKTSADVKMSMLSSGKYAEYMMHYRGRGKLQDELDNATPSYPGLILKMREGKYYYMCTRNNNFTNRSQKARITVK